MITITNPGGLVIIVTLTKHENKRINNNNNYIENHRVTSSVIKMTFFAHGGISIKLFVVYLHIINECLSYKFHPYSILTGHTKVESVAYLSLIHI